MRLRVDRVSLLLRILLLLLRFLIFVGEISIPRTVETITTMDMEQVMVVAGRGDGARCGVEARRGERARDGGKVSNRTHYAGGEAEQFFFRHARAGGRSEQKALTIPSPSVVGPHSTILLFVRFVLVGFLRYLCGIRRSFICYCCEMFLFICEYYTAEDLSVQ